MARARIVGASFADTVTLTVTSEDADHPVANLQDRAVGRTWRSTGLAQQVITIDFGEIKTLSALHIENHNLTAGAQVSVKASNAASFNPPTYFAPVALWSKRMAYASATHWFDNTGGGSLVDSGGDFLVDSGGDQLVAGSWTVPPTGRYLEIEIYDPSNPDGYYEAGRLKVGEYFEAPNSRNVQTDIALRYPERDDLIETRSGGFRSSGKVRPRELQVTWAWIAQADAFTIDANSFAELLEHIGHDDDILLSVVPTQGDDMERRMTILGRMINQPELRVHTRTADQTLYASMILVIREGL